MARIELIEPIKKIRLMCFTPGDEANYSMELAFKKDREPRISSDPKKARKFFQESVPGWTEHKGPVVVEYKDYSGMMVRFLLGVPQ